MSVLKTQNETREWLGLGAEALVEPVGELGFRLEPPCDHAQAVLAEVLRLDAERLRESVDHHVGWHRPVAVDEMVEVAGGEPDLCARPR